MAIQLQETPEERRIYYNEEWRRRTCRLYSLYHRPREFWFDDDGQGPGTGTTASRRGEAEEYQDPPHAATQHLILQGA